MKRILLIILTFNLVFSHSSIYDHSKNTTLEFSVRFTVGDINEDGEINIQDIILLVNLVLNNESNNSADLNSDDTIDILDIVLLINIILN